MPAVPTVARRFGNWLHRNLFGVYRPVYGIYKACTDRAERRLLAHCLSPGDVAVDAGANIGIYTRYLARCVGSGGAVHSFEPSAENFLRLRATAAGLPYIFLNQSAVGEKTEESLLYISDELNVDHRTYPPRDGARRTIAIKTVAIDDYFQPGSRVDLIKLDIQGYELHALRGADRVLRENPGIKLLLEFWPHGLRQAGVDWRDVLLTLEGYGLLTRQISKRGLEPLRPESIRENADWYVNLLASRSNIL